MASFLYLKLSKIKICKMKHLTYLLGFFTLLSCGTCKDATAMENNKHVMDQISGTYHVISINETDYASTDLTLQFNEKTNTVSGFSGCNRFSGTYKLNESTITFGPLASTRMACSGTQNQIEKNMIEALNNTNTLSLNNRELTLLHSNKALIKASKILEDNSKQDNGYKITYTAMSRGLFNEYVFENGEISIQKDRASTPTVKTCSQEEINTLIKEVKALELEKLNSLKAPTEKRFVDAAAIAILKVTYQGETYQTPEFDYGEPNKYIASLVSTLMGLVEKKQ